jgi:hypothetical protein
MTAHEQPDAAREVAPTLAWWTVLVLMMLALYTLADRPMLNLQVEPLRKDLGPYQNHISTIELVDYKVRILTAGTEAVTRVLVESRDTVTGERWFTVGVSPNIVDASFEALIDSITYKLMRDGAKSQ